MIDEKINKKQHSFNIWTSTFKLLKRVNALRYLETEETESMAATIHNLVKEELERLEANL